MTVESEKRYEFNLCELFRNTVVKRKNLNHYLSSSVTTTYFSVMSTMHYQRSLH